MKKVVFSLLFIVLSITCLHAQNYPNIVNYNLNETPTHGVKIKTNIPFTHGIGMPMITIEGYNPSREIANANYNVSDLKVIWYVYENKFVNPSVSTAGSSNPEVWLSVENGKIVIFLKQLVYYQRFTVSAFAQGKGEISDYFKGWTVVDEPLNGDNQTLATYKNNFAGKVGVGTDNPKSALDVRGKIIADEVEIKVNKGADFVFASDYKLPTLSEVETFVKTNEHLPEIPSEKEMQEQGINVVELQVKLLQKIEELTLYTIQQQKQLDEQSRLIEAQGKLIEELQKR